MDSECILTGDAMRLPSGSVQPHTSGEADRGMCIPPGEKNTHTPRRKKEENKKYSKQQIQLLRDFLERQKSFISILAVERNSGIKKQRLRDFMRGSQGCNKKWYKLNLRDDEIDRVHDYFMEFKEEIAEYFDSLEKPEPEQKTAPHPRKRTLANIEQVAIPKSFSAKIIRTSWYSFKIMFRLKDKGSDGNLEDIKLYIELMEELNKGKLLLKGFGTSYNTDDKELGKYTATISYQIKLEETEAEDSDD